MAVSFKNICVYTLPAATAFLLAWNMKQCSSMDGIIADNEKQDDKIAAVDSVTNARMDSVDNVLDNHAAAINRVGEQVANVNSRVNAAMDSIDSINARIDSLRKIKPCPCDDKSKPVAPRKPRQGKNNNASGRRPAPAKRDTVVVVAPVQPAIIQNGGENNSVNINNGVINNSYYNTPASTASFSATVKRRTTTVVVEQHCR